MRINLLAHNGYLRNVVRVLASAWHAAPVTDISHQQILNTSPTTALVTGGAGFVGSHLVDHLIDRNERVYVVDNLETSSPEYLNKRAEFIEADIRDSALVDVVDKIAPHSVYHLAAQASVAVSAKHPRLDAGINIDGTLNLLEAVRSMGRNPRFIYFSTGGAIYGDVPGEDLPATESMETQPLSPYGVSKLAIEIYLRAYAHLYGIDYGIVRPANIYGPRQNPHGEAGVIAIFARAMLDGKPITIFGDGSNERDYIYYSDFINGVVVVHDAKRPGPYNLGTGIGVSVSSIFNLLADLTDYGNSVRYGPPRPGDIDKISLDATRAKTDLGWVASTSLEAGLRKTVDWFRQAM